MLARTRVLMQRVSREEVTKVLATSSIPVKVDHFKCATVQTSETNLEEFTTKFPILSDEILASGASGAWVTIPKEWVPDALPVVLGAGFEMHHANPKEITCSKWLVKGVENKLPGYPWTSVGVGGLCVIPRAPPIEDDDLPETDPAFEIRRKERAEHANEPHVLVIREANGTDFVKSLLKIPGGLTDHNEDVAVGACREVFEETGILARPSGMLALRQSRFRMFGTSDIYMVHQLQAQSTKISRCSHEIAGSYWKPLSKWIEHVSTLGAFGEMISKACAEVRVPTEMPPSTLKLSEQERQELWGPYTDNPKEVSDHAFCGTVSETPGHNGKVRMYLAACKHDSPKL